MALGLSKEDEERQVSTLLYCLGEETDDVLTSMNISTGERSLQNLTPTSRCNRTLFSNVCNLTAESKRKKSLSNSSSQVFTTCRQRETDQGPFSGWYQRYEPIRKTSDGGGIKAKKLMHQRKAVNIMEDSTETESIETSYLNVVTNNHQATTS